MIEGIRNSGAIVAALLLWSAAAEADWLVLRDGARLEVNGPWKISGRQVVFTAPDGKLSSLRADQVDLEASARATEEALRARETKGDEAPSVAEPSPKARWSFSDKDFAHPTPPSEVSAVAPEEGEDGAKTAPPEAPKSSLDVVVWSQSVDPSRNRIKVSGTLQNSSKDMAASVELEVQLVDREGVVVGAQGATVRKLSLAPGESTDFVTTFPQVINYETVKFAPKASMFKVEPKEEKAKPATIPS